MESQVTKVIVVRKSSSARSVGSNPTRGTIETIMIAYKLAMQSENEYKSFFASGLATVRYEIGKPCQTPRWLEQSGRYPMVFSSIRDLWISACIWHIEEMHDIDVLTCECEEETSVLEMCDTHYLQSGIIKVSPNLPDRKSVV